MIPASSPVITDADKQAMHAAVDAGWLTEGPRTVEFEQLLAKQFGVFLRAVLTNSGSSANLLAVASMVEAGYWKAGDEILTTACAFPTTVNPLLLYGLVPVFVDCRLDTLNVDIEALRKGVSSKTKGIMLAHALGNPFDLGAVMELARALKLRVVEDCADALGATYAGKHVGSFGDIATCSFFPAHHITTGEGGAVMTSQYPLRTGVLSVRDWGRDCYCIPGKENTCGKRFSQTHGTLPFGYDHKYTYSTLGFNLKTTEIAAALGVSQIADLPARVEKRNSNYARLAGGLSDVSAISIPHATVNAVPSWFGFPIIIRETGLRTELQKYLRQEGIDSRLVFAGNITKQPFMRGRTFRIAGSLANTDKVMNDALWVGVWPGLTPEQLDYIALKIGAFFGHGI